MKMSGRICAIEHGEVEGQAFGILWICENFDKPTTRVGVMKDLLGEVMTLKFGDHIAGDVEMSTFQGKSKLRLFGIDKAGTKAA